MGASKFFPALIAILIGVVLYPVVTSFIDSANATGTNATLLNLVPLMWILGIVGVAVALGVHAFKGQ